MQKEQNRNNTDTIQNSITQKIDIKSYLGNINL
jgi:hypothetical protein